MDGPSPQPALKGALLPGVLKKKRRKSYNQRGGKGRGGGIVPFIHNIVNIHGLYYMCFSLVFACLSVRLSVWGLDLRGLAQHSPHLHLPAQPWEQNLEQVWSPILVGTSRQGWAWASTLAPEPHTCARVCVCMCMYVHGEPVCMYVQGGGSRHRGGRWGCWRQGLLGCSSQVDSPQVSGRCDGVALRAELLGTQGPQPALLAVHMPTLDGR